MVAGDAPAIDERAAAASGEGAGAFSAGGAGAVAVGPCAPAAARARAAVAAAWGAGFDVATGPLATEALEAAVAFGGAGVDPGAAGDAAAGGGGGIACAAVAIAVAAGGSCAFTCEPEILALIAAKMPPPTSATAATATIFPTGLLGLATANSSVLSGATSLRGATAGLIEGSGGGLREGGAAASGSFAAGAGALGSRPRASRSVTQALAPCLRTSVRGWSSPRFNAASSSSFDMRRLLPPRSWTCQSSRDTSSQSETGESVRIGLGLFVSGMTTSHSAQDPGGIERATSAPHRGAQRATPRSNRRNADPRARRTHRWG